MKLKLLNLALFAGGVAVSSSIWAAGPTPEMLSNTCNGCHGTNGISAGVSNPTIAGIPSATFERGMKEFRSGERPSTVMGRLAKGYTDAEIKTMADFFAAKKFVAANQSSDPQKSAAGLKLHDKRCEACHMNNGREAEEGGAPIAGQWKEYLQIEMHSFLGGKRPMTEKKAKRMGEGDHKLTAADIDALVEFYAGQK